MDKFERMKAADFREMIKNQASGKPNKFSAVKTECDGKIYDSGHEANRHCELQLLERAGVITALQEQVKFVLIPKSEYGQEISYIADFVYFEKGHMVVEDAKSPPTQKQKDYRLKKRMLAERYGIIIKETIKNEGDNKSCYNKQSKKSKTR